MTNTKQKTIWRRIIKSSGIIVLYFMLIFGGFALGLVYEQVMIAQLAMNALSGTNLEVNINFNATEFVQEINNTLVPAWKTAFNETLQNRVGIGTESPNDTLNIGQGQFKLLYCNNRESGNECIERNNYTLNITKNG